MGLLKVEATFCNYEQPERRVVVDALVDETKFMSVVPSSVLHKLGVMPARQQNFRFPDGIVRRMNIGQVRVRIDDREATTQVMFGEEDAQPLLGRLTLGGLLLVIDPIDKQLVPMDFIPA